MDAPEGRAVACELQSLLPDDLSPSLIFAIHPVTISDILLSVAEFYDVNPSHIRDNRIRDRLKRKRGCGRVCWSRHVVCYLAREMTRLSQAVIAGRIGNFHNYTCWYGERRIAEACAANEIVRDDLDILRRRIVDRTLDRWEGSTWH